MIGVSDSDVGIFMNLGMVTAHLFEAFCGWRSDFSYQHSEKMNRTPWLNDFTPKERRSNGNTRTCQ
jgi:hypothetical protein